MVFISGFYEEFIRSLHTLFERDVVQRRQAIRFLIKLGIGWIAGMGLTATVLAQVFDSGVHMLSFGVYRTDDRGDPVHQELRHEGRLNLRYVFDRLFCPIPEKEEDYCIGKELVQVVKDYKDGWDKLKKIAQILREKLAR